MITTLHGANDKKCAEIFDNCILHHHPLMLGVEEFFNRREVCVQNHELALRVIRLNNTSHRQDCIKREIYCSLLGLFPPLIDIHNNS